MAATQQDRHERASLQPRLGRPHAPAERFGKPERPARLRGRAETMTWSGLNVLAGIWLIISPFVLGYSGRDATWNPIVFGAIVGVLALARFAGAFAGRALSGVNMAIGVWLFISAWWLADTTRAAWNVGIMGVVVFALAGLAASATAIEDTIASQRI